MGILAFEDKWVQDAFCWVLEAIYEHDFLACSYGFPPKRSVPDAIRPLDRMVHRAEAIRILEGVTGSTRRLPCVAVVCGESASCGEHVLERRADVSALRLETDSAEAAGLA